MRVALLVMVACLMGCGGDDNQGGGGGGSNFLSTGTVCTQLGHAICVNGQRVCGGTRPESECESAFVAACCTNNSTCAFTSPDTQPEVSRCVTDLGTWPCSSYQNGLLPSSCEIL